MWSRVPRNLSYLEMSNRVLKMVEAWFPVTHGIMGTPFALSLKCETFAHFKALRTHTHAKCLWWLKLFSCDTWG